MDQLIDQYGIRSAAANGIRKLLCGVNPYLKELTDLKGYIADQQAGPQYSSRINVTVQDHEIGVIRHQNQVDMPLYSFSLGGDVQNRQGFIHSSSNQVEPLLYPLLFPYGELGWGSNLMRQNSKVPLLEYLKSRIL